VKDDVDGLKKTGLSLRALPDRALIEWIVWINEKTLCIKDHVNAATSCAADQVIVDFDIGIFDAMSKALKFVNGQFVLFLNAKDTVEEPFDVRMIRGAHTIPVIYRNFFSKDVLVGVKGTLKLGIPYCHQGLVLPADKLHIDGSMKYAADYKSLIDSNISWPIPSLQYGLIRFDSSGVSTNNRLLSDIWTLKVIYEYYGLFYSFVFILRSVFRIAVKRILNVFIRKTY